MDFPANIETMKKKIAHKDNEIAVLRNSIGILTNRIERLEQEEEEKQEIVNILNGLLNSWQQSYPGKNEDAFFFLDASTQQVVVQELLKEGTKRCQNQTKWSEYLSTRSSSDSKYTEVPFWYPVIFFSEVRKSPSRLLDLNI